MHPSAARLESGKPEQPVEARSVRHDQP